MSTGSWIVNIAYRSVTDPSLNTTSVGGILRGVAGTWINGFVDDVALWNAVLQSEDILDLATGTSPLGIGGGGDGLVVTSVVRNGETDAVTLTWNSIPGKTYAVRFSSNLEGDVATWTDLVDQFPSGGESTSFTVPSQAASRVLYVVIEE